MIRISNTGQTTPRSKGNQGGISNSVTEGRDCDFGAPSSNQHLPSRIQKRLRHRIGKEASTNTLTEGNWTQPSPSRNPHTVSQLSNADPRPLQLESSFFERHHLDFSRHTYRKPEIPGGARFCQPNKLSRRQLPHPRSLKANPTSIGTG